METHDILNLKSLKLLIKGSLVIIVSFAVLYCSVVVILLHLEKDIGICKDLGSNVFKLILILVISCIPLIVFFFVFFGFFYFLKMKKKCLTKDPSFYY